MLRQTTYLQDLAIDTDMPVTRQLETSAANQKEMHMKIPKWTLLTTAVAAAVMAAALGLVNVAQAVNQYGSHFDHPDFKPIRNVH